MKKILFALIGVVGVLPDVLGAACIGNQNVAGSITVAGNSVTYNPARAKGYECKNSCDGIIGVNNGSEFYYCDGSTWQHVYGHEAEVLVVGAAGGDHVTIIDIARTNNSAIGSEGIEFEKFMNGNNELSNGFNAGAKYADIKAQYKCKSGFTKVKRGNGYICLATDRFFLKITGGTGVKYGVDETVVETAYACATDIKLATDSGNDEDFARSVGNDNYFVGTDKKIFKCTHGNGWDNGRELKDVTDTNVIASCFNADATYVSNNFDQILALTGDRVSNWNVEASIAQAEIKNAAEIKAAYCKKTKCIDGYTLKVSFQEDGCEMTNENRRCEYKNAWASGTENILDYANDNTIASSSHSNGFACNTDAVESCNIDDWVVLFPPNNYKGNPHKAKCQSNNTWGDMKEITVNRMAGTFANRVGLFNGSSANADIDSNKIVWVDDSNSPTETERQNKKISDIDGLNPANIIYYYIPCAAGYKATEEGTCGISISSGDTTWIKVRQEDGTEVAYNMTWEEFGAQLGGQFLSDKLRSIVNEGSEGEKIQVKEFLEEYIDSNEQLSTALIDKISGVLGNEVFVAWLEAGSADEKINESITNWINDNSNKTRIENLIVEQGLDHLKNYYFNPDGSPKDAFNKFMSSDIKSDVLKAFLDYLNSNIVTTIDKWSPDIIHQLVEKLGGNDTAQKKLLEQLAAGLYGAAGLDPSKKDELLAAIAQQLNVTKTDLEKMAADAGAKAGAAAGKAAVDQLAVETKTAIDAFRLQSEIKEGWKELTDFEKSGWVTKDGKFNGLRLGLDIGGGALVGTVGGVATNALMKKSQLEKGFSSFQCSFSGGTAGYGESFIAR